MNENKVKESDKEKYLGDYLTKYANPHATIEDRNQKGHGILSNMKAILDEIPLGNRRLEIGLTLRESWFLNGTLYNSEVWCAYLNKDLKVLELLDKKILRLILGAHSKVPCEMLYLESGALPLRHVIIVRRLSYLQTILKSHEDEIIRKIYSAQKRNPCKGDWIKLVEVDMKEIDMNIQDEYIEQMNEGYFKEMIQHKVRQHAFKELKLL